MGKRGDGRSELPDEDAGQSDVQYCVEHQHCCGSMWLDPNSTDAVHAGVVRFRRDEFDAHYDTVSAYRCDRTNNPKRVTTTLYKWRTHDANPFQKKQSAITCQNRWYRHDLYVQRKLCHCIHDNTNPYCSVALTL